jgi:hypothetical protein
MPYYRVNVQTVASGWVDVEAEDEEAAIEAAYDNLPYAPGFANYDFGEWALSSEFQRANGDPNPSTEWDVEEIDEDTYGGRW